MTGAKVSIPNNVRKTIQNIKEITGNHTEDEIYVTLKECSMDPNETVQKLLLQDPFHEVKRKRDRKKEIPNKESTESRWKPGMQGPGNWGGRGNNASRHISNGGGRTSLSAKENGINQGAEDGPNPPMPQGQKKKETFVVSSSSDKKQFEITASTASSKFDDSLPPIPPIQASKGPTDAMGSGNTGGPLMPGSNNTSASETQSHSPRVYLSYSDPILTPSQESRLHASTIRHEVRSQQTPVEEIHETPLEIKSTACNDSGSDNGNSSMGKAPSELQRVGKNLPSDSSQPTPSSHVSFSSSRPSSNYNNRLQQAIGPQKVGPSMAWKPKPTNPVLESIKVPAVPVEVQTPTVSASSNLDTNDATHVLEKKLEESHILDDQHVIIPNHLYVPEAEKLGFCFGSFDASFNFNASSSNGPVSDKSFEASEVVDESIEEQPRNQNALATSDEGDHPDRPTSSSNIPENLLAERDDATSDPPTEYIESKQEFSLPTTSHPYPVVHSSPNFSFGFVAPMIGTHLTSFETNESQGRDGSHIPSFVVQQPFDPASYYAQFYRHGTDGDGRLSPFHSTGVPPKFNGNVPVLSSHSSQEVENSLMLSGPGSTPTSITQSGGLTQSSIAVTQQPLPVFRHPTGIHLPHYPPNYLPYGPYFPPFYIPPQAIHQYLNGAFPQQPLASPKYPLPQYKPGSNTGNHPAHIGMHGNYGPYGSNPAGYNSGSANTAGNSTSNEDLGGSQFEESNGYITGQQSEATGVWIGPPSREMSGIPANSFYNLPQSGQLAYTQTQANHGPFAGIYHPTQPVTTTTVNPLLQQSQTLSGTGVDMVGPTSQINWPNSY